MPRSGEEKVLWLRWLTRLRWVALIAQAVTLSFAYPLLDSWSVLLALAVVMVLLLLANLRALQVLAREEPVAELTLLWQLGLDVLALTGFFLLGGGADNPFTVLYLVHVAMGSVMLPPRHAASLTVGVLGCYVALHFWNLPLHYENHSLDPAMLRPLGSLTAFTVTTISVAVFVVGLADTLRRRERQLLEARDRTSRTDRLRSVGTLAAGAAHELNTPLSTIGLRLRRVRRRYGDQETVRDLDVMKTQLDRCTRIVQQLLAGAGDPSAIGMEVTPMCELVEQSIRLWTKGTSLEVTVADQSLGASVNLPRIAFAQAFTNLLENAREAQESVDAFDPLEITLEADEDQVRLLLRDHGCGLPEGPDQIGTPFYTTKRQGTGLGVFVARQVADGAGGGLRYKNHVQGGTTALWWFPRASARRNNEPEGHPTQAAGGG